MTSIQNYLSDLLNGLEQRNLKDCVSQVRLISDAGSMLKVAQYVGAIGYVLKQNRALGNCYRKKRSESSNTSPQEVIFECLKEYQDGQRYDNNEWTEKYAQMVQSRPEQFEQSELQFVCDMQSELNIDYHLDLLNKTAAYLNSNGIETESIDELIAYVDIYHNYLDKKAEQNNLVKIAQLTPQNTMNKQRGGWSRLWRPSKGHILDPRSWSKKFRQQGEDEDTIWDMRRILEGIINFETTAREMKNAVKNLKRFTTGQPRLDSFLNSLDESNYDKTVQNVDSLESGLQHALSSSSPIPEIARLQQPLADVSNGLNQMRNNINTLRESVNALRQRAPVMGRGQGPLGSGSSPSVIYSPAQEMQDFQRVLDKMYANPFDDRAALYAQSAHSRLWDKLRYIQRGIDPDVSNWLNPSQTSSPVGPAAQAENQPTTPSLMTNAPSSTTGPAAAQSSSPASVTNTYPTPVDKTRVDYFKNKISELPEISKPAVMKDLVSLLKNNSPDVLPALLMALQELSASTQISPAPAPPPATTPPVPATAPVITPGRSAIHTRPVPTSTVRTPSLTT